MDDPEETEQGISSSNKRRESDPISTQQPQGNTPVQLPPASECFPPQPSNHSLLLNFPNPTNTSTSNNNRIGTASTNGTPSPPSPPPSNKSDHRRFSNDSASNPPASSNAAATSALLSRAAAAAAISAAANPSQQNSTTSPGHSPSQFLYNRNRTALWQMLRNNAVSQFTLGNLADYSAAAAAAAAVAGNNPTSTGSTAGGSAPSSIFSNANIQEMYLQHIRGSAAAAAAGEGSVLVGGRGGGAESMLHPASGSIAAAAVAGGGILLDSNWSHGGRVIPTIIPSGANLFMEGITNDDEEGENDDIDEDDDMGNSGYDDDDEGEEEDVTGSLYDAIANIKAQKDMERNKYQDDDKKEEGGEKDADNDKKEEEEDGEKAAYDDNVVEEDINPDAPLNEEKIEEKNRETMTSSELLDDKKNENKTEATNTTTTTTTLLEKDEKESFPQSNNDNNENLLSTNTTNNTEPVPEPSPPQPQPQNEKSESSKEQEGFPQQPQQQQPQKQNEEEKKEDDQEEEDEVYSRHWQKYKYLTFAQCQETRIAIQYSCRAVLQHTKTQGGNWAAILGGDANNVIGMYDTREEALKRAITAASIMNEVDCSGGISTKDVSSVLCSSSAKPFAVTNYVVKGKRRKSRKKRNSMELGETDNAAATAAAAAVAVAEDDDDDEDDEDYEDEEQDAMMEYGEEEEEEADDDTNSCVSSISSKLSKPVASITEHIDALPNIAACPHATPLDNNDNKDNDDNKQLLLEQKDPAAISNIPATGSGVKVRKSKRKKVGFYIGKPKACQVSDPNTGAVLYTFRSCCQAERVTRISRSLIGKACRQGGGVIEDKHFQFVDNVNIDDFTPVAPDQSNTAVSPTNIINKKPRLSKTPLSASITTTAALPMDGDISPTTSPIQLKDPPSLPPTQPTPPILNDNLNLLPQQQQQSPSTAAATPLHSSILTPIKPSSRIIDKTCIICQNNPSQIIFHPCRHCVLCSSCSDAGLCSKFCPMCRTRIEKRLQPNKARLVRPRIYSVFTF